MRNHSTSWQNIASKIVKNYSKLLDNPDKLCYTIINIIIPRISAHNFRTRLRLVFALPWAGVHSIFTEFWHCLWRRRCRHPLFIRVSGVLDRNKTPAKVFCRKVECRNVYAGWRWRVDLGNKKIGLFIAHVLTGHLSYGIIGAFGTTVPCQ